MTVGRCKGRDRYVSCITGDNHVFAKLYEYLIFLKNHFLECRPQFSAVIKEATIDSQRGQLTVLHIAEEICDPTLNIVAACEVNRIPMFLYQDKYFVTQVVSCRSCLQEIYRAVDLCNILTEPVLVLLEIKPPDPEDIIV